MSTPKIYRTARRYRGQAKAEMELLLAKVESQLVGVESRLAAMASQLAQIETNLTALPETGNVTLSGVPSTTANCLSLYKSQFP